MLYEILEDVVFELIVYTLFLPAKIDQVFYETAPKTPLRIYKTVQDLELTSSD